LGLNKKANIGAKRLNIGAKKAKKATALILGLKRLKRLILGLKRLILGY
jgi:hypothetical protein